MITLYTEGNTMETQESKNLMYLNQEYIDLKNSPLYQKALKKRKIRENLRRGGIKYILHYLKWRVKKTVRQKEVSETEIPDTEANRNARIAVYTCITGNYDTIKEPLYCNPDIDYFIVTDMDVPEESIWKKIDINEIPGIEMLSASDKNRYIKFFPHILFPEYDFSIYVDGVIQIVADMAPIVENMGDCIIGVHRHNARSCVYDEARAIIYAKRASKEKVFEQINRYKNEKYPKGNGLYENTVLVRKHNDESCIRLMSEWWKEYMISCKRDQLSLPYVIWKEKFDPKKIYIIGDNLDLNPRFKRTFKHKK